MPSETIKKNQFKIGDEVSFDIGGFTRGIVLDTPELDHFRTYKVLVRYNGFQGKKCLNILESSLKKVEDLA